MGAVMAVAALVQSDGGRSDPEVVGSGGLDFRGM